MAKLKKNNSKQEPHIGDLLTSYIKENRVYQAALCRILGLNKGAIMYHRKKSSMQTKTLYKICHALKHNFFMDLAFQLPKEYSCNNDIFEIKDKKIAALEEEVKRLKQDKELLNSILKAR